MRMIKFPTRQARSTSELHAVTSFYPILSYPIPPNTSLDDWPLYFPFVSSFLPTKRSASISSGLLALFRHGAMTGAYQTRAG